MIVKPLEWIEDGKILHGEVVCDEHTPSPLQFVIDVPFTIIARAGTLDAMKEFLQAMWTIGVRKRKHVQCNHISEELPWAEIPARS